VIENVHVQGARKVFFYQGETCVWKNFGQKKQFREGREAQFCPGLCIAIIILALTSTEPEFCLENGRD